MSHLMKALKKAHQEQSNVGASTDHDKTEPNPQLSVYDHTHTRTSLKQPDIHLIFTGILIVLVGVGIYFNYNISSNLAMTKSGMAAISDNFRAQESKLGHMNDLIRHMDNVNSGQGKEFLAKLDGLNANFAAQIDEVQKLSRSHYLELSKTIEEQEKSIAVLTSNYEQLEKAVRNYSDVNTSYAEQLNALKKKLAELNLSEPKN